MKKRIYRSKKTGKLYEENPDGTINIEKPIIRHINIRLWKFIAENNVFRIYEKK